MTARKKSATDEAAAPEPKAKGSEKYTTGVKCYGCGAVNLLVDVEAGVTEFDCGECGRPQGAVAVVVAKVK